MSARKGKQRTEDLLASVPSPLEGEVGSGVVILKVARMKAVLERTPSFARKAFSAEECAYCERHATPEVPFALRFAAKSAVLKALDAGYVDGVGVRDIEVKRNAKGRAYVVLGGKARQIAAEKGVVDMPLSLSFTHTDAVACALAITRDSQRVAEERTNPMEELAQKFKEARTLLDAMDSPKAARASEGSGAGEVNAGLRADAKQGGKE